MVRRQLRPWRRSSRAEGIFEAAESVWTSSGGLWGGRLLSLEGRRPLTDVEHGNLELNTHEVNNTAHVLADWEGIHALTAWRAHNRGTVVEHRIKELVQLSVRRTAVDDPEGDALLLRWAPSPIKCSMGSALWPCRARGERPGPTGSEPGSPGSPTASPITRARATCNCGAKPFRGRLIQALRHIARLRGSPLVTAV